MMPTATGLLIIRAITPQIDHILLSPELAGRIVNTYIQQDYNPMEVSDHFLIVVKMKLSSILLPVIDDGKTLIPTVGDPKPEPTPSVTPKTTTAPKSKPKSDREYLQGSRGGCYYLTKGGNKKYVARSLCAEDSSTSDEPETTTTTPATPKKSSSDGRTYLKGSRGGCYYLTKSGRKKYVDRSKCN